MLRHLFPRAAFPPTSPCPLLLDVTPLLQPSLTEPGPVHLPQGVRHASFVAQESCQVDRFAGIILRPRLHPPSVAAASLVGEEAQVAMPGSRELAVGLRRGRTKISLTLYPRRHQRDQTQRTVENLPFNISEHWKDSGLFLLSNLRKRTRNSMGFCLSFHHMHQRNQ